MSAPADFILRDAPDPRAGLVRWLREDDPTRVAALLAEADRVRAAHVGDEVHLRGLIEFSNECQRACAYCGLRAPNQGLARYRMSIEEVLAAAAIADTRGYGTVVLQSGEDDRITAAWVSDLVRAIRARTDLAITLSLGERSLDDYREWFRLGANRVLLKFETSDPDLYRRIHPPRRPGELSRIELLIALREIGYQIGSGVMIGIPGQTYPILAADLELFARLDLDMIGVGPYIAGADTPLGRDAAAISAATPDQVPPTDLMTYKAIALTRLLCPDANLPTTTALSTISASGRVSGLRAGANVIMPNVTPLEYRLLYQVYPGKSDLSGDQLHDLVLESIREAGRCTGTGRGDRGRR
jgi:biotin synthase